jgi:hypothetical protein
LTVLTVLYAHYYISIQIDTQNARKKSMSSKKNWALGEGGLLNSPKGRIMRVYDCLSKSPKMEPLLSELQRQTLQFRH